MNEIEKEIAQYTSVRVIECILSKLIYLVDILHREESNRGREHFFLWCVLRPEENIMCFRFL